MILALSLKMSSCGLRVVNTLGGGGAPRREFSGCGFQWAFFQVEKLRSIWPCAVLPQADEDTS